MGYAVSWMAIRRKSRDTLLQELKLNPTGEREEIPDSPVSGTTLPGGWYLLFANQCAFIPTLPMNELSTNADIIFCVIEEHVMYSHACGWENGIEIWSVTHDSSKGITHLDAQGTLPAPFTAIRERLLAEQASREAEEARVDYVFDVPLKLAQELIGFKHDEDLSPSDEDRWEVLELPEGRKTEETKKSGCLGLLLLPGVIVAGWLIHRIP